LTDAHTVRLVLDQGIPRDAAEVLRALNYECVHVGEVGMWCAADEEILAFAAERKAIIVTLDADFHTMLAVSGSSGPSVIRIRMQGLRAPAISHLTQQALAAFSEDLHAGTLLTIKMQKTTCHRLPIGKEA